MRKVKSTFSPAEKEILIALSAEVQDKNLLKSRDNSKLIKDKKESLA